MRQFNFRWLAALVVLLGMSSASMAAELLPDQLAKSTTQDVIAILKADKEIQGGNVQKVYELVEAKVLPHFDFNRMTQLAVGKHWNAATPQQKQSLVKEFRALLVRTYATSLTEFSNQVIEFKPLSMKPDDEDVTVQTEVKQPGGKPIPIDYAMYKTAFGWKVYDVAIDSVSLVINYRSSFASTIRKSGIDGLIAMLEAKSKGTAKKLDKNTKSTPAKTQARQPAKPVVKAPVPPAKPAHTSASTSK